MDAARTSYGLECRGPGAVGDAVGDDRGGSVRSPSRRRRFRPCPETSWTHPATCGPKPSRTRAADDDADLGHDAFSCLGFWGVHGHAVAVVVGPYANTHTDAAAASIVRRWAAVVDR